MAIDDVSFFTVTGEEISREYLVNQMIGYYNMKLGIGETKVTDFNEGSEIRNLLESIAIDSYIIMEDKNELSKIAFIETAEGEFLDMHGDHPLIQLKRDTGTEASGSVTFSVSDEIETDITIPEGTIVLNRDTGIEYATLYDAIIPVSDRIVTVAIQCLTTGTDGNCPSNSIDFIDDDISSDIPTLTVYNENPVRGGTEYEDDEEYRERLLAFKRKNDFGSLSYYTNLSNNIEDIHDVLLVDDETQNNFTKIVVVNGTVKPTPSEVLSRVLELYTNPLNKVIGHNFGVERPSYVSVDVNIVLNVSSEVDENIIDNLVSKIFDGGSSLDLGYPIEFEGLFMGENLRSEVFNSNLNLVDGVNSVVTTFSTDQETDISFLELEEREVGMLRIVSITQNLEA